MEVGDLVEITDQEPFLAKGFSKMNIPEVGIFDGYKHCGYAYIRGLDKKMKAFRHVYASVDKAKLPFKALRGKMKQQIMGLKSTIERANLGTALTASVDSTGTDPEIFVMNGKDLIPAFEFLGDKPKNLIGDTDAYWDGFQAEFRTKATTCLAYEVDYIRDGLRAVLKAAKLKVPKAKLSIKSVVEIPARMLQEADKKYIAMGCAPSKNAYGNEAIQVDDGRKLPWRCAGGHIHLSTLATPKQEVEGVKALDYLLGVASVSLFRDYDSAVRRELYGLAGEYRKPTWGIEYRVLPNTWLCHPAICHLIFDFARVAYRLGASGLLQHVEGTDKQVQEIINACDVKGARVLMAKNKDVYNSLLATCYGYWGSKNDSVEQAYSAFREGLAEVVKDPEDIEGNWMFDTAWQCHSEAPNCQWNKAAVTLKSGKKV